MRSAFAFVLVVPFAASCGGAQPAPAEASAPASTAAPATSGQPAAGTGASAWSQMKVDDKIEFMKSHVVPKMKEDFAAFDAKKFEKITCQTCHGEGAKKGEFKMPNPNLPKLSADGGFKKHMDKTPEITKFMMQKVVPDMAALIGEQPYDPKTQQGFGCFRCHVKE